LPSSNNIKAILFDLDGTLRIHLPSGGEVFTEYVSRLGLPLSEEDKTRAARWEHYYFANSPEIQADNQIFKEDRQGFWVNFGRRRLVALGCHPSEAIELAPAVSAHMAEAYRPQVHVPEEARALLPALQEMGYTLGVVSNRDDPYQEELRELGLEGHFKFSLAGGEVQSFKPEPGIFQHALNLAGTSAPETVYVGDNYFADVVGSSRAGLRPVLYDPVSLFPDADCAVIRSFDELPQVLQAL
jgi:HAD superfamily hydrolase (TIGR01549 family)